MSSNPQNDDFPTIRLDEEDRRGYQQKKQSSTKANAQNNAKNHTAKKSSSGLPVMATLAFLIAAAASGACYYLWDLSVKQAATAQAAEARIAELERKLSATDEEMGESTVALQVKVNELAERTDELWQQMDKLWASAWRRNQKEIADLGARVTRVQTELQESINQVNRNTNSQQTKVAAVETQLTGLADELLAINVQIEQVSASREDTLQTNKNMQEQLAVIEQRNNALSGRITQLENEIKSMATKILSQSASSSTPSPSGGTPQ